MTLNEKIIEEAKTWIGVPYVHRGINKRGADCTGMLIGILQTLGYGPNFFLRKYPKDWNLHAMANDYIVEQLAQVAIRVPKKDKQPGDVLVFRWGKCNSHTGVLFNEHLFIHSMAGSVCRYSSLKREEHSKRMSMIFRIEEDLLKGIS